MASEARWAVDCDFMEKQERITEQVRSKMVDWLAQMHYNFKLKNESLFLTVNTLDRFLQTRQIANREMQLVSVAAMHTACKYEEIYPPGLQDYVHISDESFTERQLKDKEVDILTALDWNLQLASAYRFLERFAKLAALDAVSTCLAHYLLELGLLDSKMHQHRQSLQAVAAIYLAGKYREAGPSLSAVALIEKLGLKKHFAPEAIRSCAKCFDYLATLIQKSALQVITQKFKSEKLFEVSRIVSKCIK